MQKMRGGSEIKTKLKILFITVFSVIILDQATKAVIIRRLYLNEAIEVIPGFFSIVYFRNPGAAFGIFNRGGILSLVFLIGASIAALVIIAVLLRQARDSFTSFTLSLIAGGAVGNLIDRVRFGTVVDFLYFYIRDYHWPAFNVADSAITAGVMLAIYSFYFKHSEG